MGQAPHKLRVIGIFPSLKIKFYSFQFIDCPIDENCRFIQINFHRLDNKNQIEIEKQMKNATK